MTEQNLNLKDVKTETEHSWMTPKVFIIAESDYKLSVDREQKEDTKN